MSCFLLLIALGPVQDFIAQARRTRDLWYGSHLLSELSRAVARALIDGGAELVFPALQHGDPELKSCLAPLRAQGKAPHNIANKLLAEVPEGIDPEILAQAARTEVMRFWHDDIAMVVKLACAKLLADGLDDVWDEQIDTFLEFSASWASLDNGYTEARKNVERALSGRKNLREFSAWQCGRGAVPKSSLDGGRETVLPRRRDRTLAAKYRIREKEQLDAVGLVKRAGGEPDQFVSIINVALASWLDFAHSKAAGELERLRKACREKNLSWTRRPNLPCVKAFPFDASVLLRDRWKAVFKEQDISGSPQEWGEKFVAPLLKTLGDPYPYVACLVADGDSMGRALDAVDSPDNHRQFSCALAGFADDARRIVEQDHCGSLVYAGGDDVLAFLPLPQALSAADALRKAFAAAMIDALPSRDQPTLSVGIGVGHIMENMGGLLELGREAERHAKGNSLGERSRNALAIIVEKRSGGKRIWRARWDEWGGDPVVRLRADATLLEECQLSITKIYAVDRTLVHLPKPEQITLTENFAWAQLLAAEIRRLFARVYAGEQPIDLDTIGLASEVVTDYAALYAEVTAWVNRMLVSRTFAQAQPQLRGVSLGAAL